MSLIAAMLVAVIAAASGAPATPPPKVGGASASPLGVGGLWQLLLVGSWKHCCLRRHDPVGNAADLARLRAKTGATVRLHLRLTPRTVRVFRLSNSTRTPVLRARAGRTVNWLARPGIIDVEVTAAGGSASYLVRLSSAGA